MSATITATEPEWRPLDLTFPAQPNQTDAAWAAVGKQYVLHYFHPYLYTSIFPGTIQLTPRSSPPACSATQAPSPSATPSPPTPPRARSSTGPSTWPPSRPGSAPARLGTTPCSRTPTGTRCSGSPRRGRPAPRTCGGESCLLGCDWLRWEAACSRLCFDVLLYICTSSHTLSSYISKARRDASVSLETSNVQFPCSAFVRRTKKSRLNC